jgi:predicted RNase H-like nuclease (RuvC/YqgF family)
MTIDQILTLLLYLIGGGAFWKMIESVTVTLLNKGKGRMEQMNDRVSELEKDIISLKGIIKELEAKNTVLNDLYYDYRDKYSMLMVHTERLTITIEERNLTITQLEHQIKALRDIIECDHADVCPFIERNHDHSDPPEPKEAKHD